MNVCVVGSGYVGLVTGTCFADMGNKVWCVDVDAEKIDKLKSGILPIYEPGLEEMVKKNVKEGRLNFTTNLAQGLEDALFCFIAVGTPPGEDGSADLTYVLQVARSIGQNMHKYLIVVDKSTVPVGTADKVRAVISEELVARNRGNLEFDVVSNPEFLKEGAAIDDFINPDRVVIGTDNVRTEELMRQLYAPFAKNLRPIVCMDVKSAEITKYAANAMLATRISFMNEIARLCDKVGGDVNMVRQGVGMDSRVGMRFLYAGIGYGGSCFPKDVQELIRTGRRNGVEMSIIEAVEKANNQQKTYLVDMIRARFGEDLSGKKFGIWGLAFKPQTDDMREAPSVIIINQLIARGAQIVAYDPVAMDQAASILAAQQAQAQVKFAESMVDATDDIDALLLVTEWRQFRQPDFAELKRRMRQPIIFDGRNQYTPEDLLEVGFEYYCVGRYRTVR